MVMKEHQAWNGVPQSYLDSNRKFNPYNYENEVDDYGQTHFQLHYNKQFNDRTFLNPNYTTLKDLVFTNNTRVVNITLF